MRFIVIALALLAGNTPALSNSTITYQGQLQDSGEPFTGNANLTFRLYDQEDGGNQIGSELNFLGHPVVDGLFQVALDFGSGAFDGSSRWLEIRIDGAPLDKRQSLASVPLAQYALDAPDTLASLSCGEDEVAKWDGSSWHCAPDEIDPAVWTVTNGVAVFEGDAMTEGGHEVGEGLTVGGELQFGDATPQRTAGPIAKGWINADGSIENAVNVSGAQWVSSEDRYRINIAGEFYFFDEYVTVITPIVSSLTQRTTSNSGALIVEFRDSNDDLVQSQFQFVTYKLPVGSVTNSADHASE